MANEYQQYTGGGSEYGAVLGHTGLEAILKDWTEALQSMVKTQAEVLDYFGEGDFEWSGRDVIVPLQTKLSGSFAAIPEGGVLPRAGRSEYIQSRAHRAHVYARMQITGPAIAATKGSKGALFRAAEKEMKDLQKSVVAEMSRMFFGSSTGVLAKVAAYNKGVVTMDDKVTDGWTNTSPLFPGMRICWGAEADLGTQGGQKGHGEVVAVLSDTTFSIAVLGGVDPVVGNLMVCGDDRANSYKHEFVGLKDLLNPKLAIQEVDPKTYPWWVAQTYQANNGGGNIALSPTLLMTGIVKYGKLFEGDPVPDTMIVVPEVLIEHFDALYPNQRFVPGSYTTGLKDENALRFVYKGKQIRWFETPLAPRYSIVFLEKAYLKYAWQQRLNWLRSRNNGNIIEPVPDIDAVQAVFGGYGQMITLDRRRMLQMTEINHSVL